MIQFKLFVIVLIACASAEEIIQTSSMTDNLNHHVEPEIPSKRLEPLEESDFSRNLNVEVPNLVNNFETDDNLNPLPARVEQNSSENLVEAQKNGNEEDLKGDATFWWPRFYRVYPRYYYRPRYYNHYSPYYW